MNRLFLSFLISKKHSIMHYPHHIAIIPDWNRTRAKEQWKTSMEGHLAGSKNAISLLEYTFSNTTISTVTIWFLSTENVTWRSKAELDFLFSLYKIIWTDLDALLEKYSINFRWAGSRAGLPDTFLDFLDTKTQNHIYPDSPNTIVFCANYGGRDEIIRWIRKIPSNKIESITEEEFSRYLDFGSIEPVDLVIRTKGSIAQRTSGFLAWRIGYAELYFTPEYFPAFWPENLEKALLWYNSIAEWRNFGK